MTDAERTRVMISWEAGREAVKLLCGASVLIVLMFINSDIHLIATNPSSLDHVVWAPPTVNCTSGEIDPMLKIRVDVCEPPSIAIYLDKSILRAYSGRNAGEFVEWLRRCIGPNFRKDCSVRPTKFCPQYVPYADSGLCYHSDFSLSFLVIGRFRFSKEESEKVIHYIVNHTHY